MFKIFVEILYSEKVNLLLLSLIFLDKLYQLADKYLVLDIQESLIRAADILAAREVKRTVVNINILNAIESNTIKEVVNNIVLNFLNSDSWIPRRRAVKSKDEFCYLPEAYFSGRFSEPVKAGIVRAAIIYIQHLDFNLNYSREEELNESTDGGNSGMGAVFDYLPESENNSRFLHKVRKNWNKDFRIFNTKTEKIMQLFSQWGKDGYVTVPGMKTVMDGMGERMEKHEVRSIVNNMDSCIDTGYSASFMYSEIFREEP